MSLVGAPGHGDDDRTTGNFTWAMQIERYISASSAGDPVLLAERKGFLDQLHSNPSSAQAWAAFLINEEAIAASIGRACKSNPGLAQLFQRSIEMVPRARTGQVAEAYICLWIGHARQQWYRNEDEGRDLFKALKNQHLADSNSSLYREWALLEQRSGNVSKAVSILQKGLKESAEPRSMLEDLLAQIQASPKAGIVERKVHFQEAPTTDGLGSVRRSFASTPGCHLKSQDSCFTSSSYTQMSSVTSSTSRSSPLTLGGDVYLGLTGQQPQTMTGVAPSKSQASCLSHGSDEDTIACRPREDTRTQVALGVSGGTGANALSTGGNTATVTMPSGISSTLNLAAGAAAVAALGSGTAGGASGSASGSGGGSNTGNIGIGMQIRRYGLKSKAVRCIPGDVTTEPGQEKPSTSAADIVSPTLTAGAPPGLRSSMAAPAPPGRTESPPRPLALDAAGGKTPATLGVGEAGSLLLPVGPRSPSKSAATADAGFPSTDMAAVPEPLTRADENDEASTRKRRAAAEAAQSPARMVCSVVLQDEGVKRRQSPDLAVDAGASLLRGGSALAGPADRGALAAMQMRNSLESLRASGPLASISLPNPSLQELPAASASASGSVTLATRSAAVRPAQQASFSGVPAVRDVAMEAQAGSLGSLSAAAPMSVERRAAAPGPGSGSVLQARTPLAPAGSTLRTAQGAAGGVDPMAIDQNQPPAVAAVGSSDFSMPRKQPLGGAAIPQQQLPGQDGREPLRELGTVASRTALGPPPAVPALAQPYPQEAPRLQAQVQPAAQQPQVAAFNWPERLEQSQDRPIESELYVYVHGYRYQKLDLAGKGGSSKVYKVLGCNRGIYALKRVRFHNKDQEAVKGFIDEISLLRTLRGQNNIIQLIDAQVFRDDGLVYMVLEYGDIDLARLLHSHEEARRRAASGAGAGGSSAAGGPDAEPSSCQEIDTNFIRLYWQQMLQAVKCIHNSRIVHADLKPANFMLVQGQLKLIDFGIAKAIQGDTTSINRESQVGTLNYMSPEAIQGGSQNPLGGPPLKVGRPSDVWSLGCILYQMIYGRTPFADLQFIPKMNAICNPSYQIPMPECGEPDAVDCIRRCLDRNPKTRISLQELLDHPFLHPNRRKQQPQPAPQSFPAVQGAAAPAAASLTEEQIKAILQMANSNSGGDLDSIVRAVKEQLAARGEDLTGSTTRMADGAPLLQAQPAAAPAPPAAPPPPPGPPPPPLLRAPPPARMPPAPPPPAPSLSGLVAAGQSSAAPRAPGAPLAPAVLPGLAAREDKAHGSMGDIAAMAAAAAVRRAAKPPGAEPAKATAQPRPAGPHGGPLGAGSLLPLGGAELQAAILKRRAQLRPVHEQAQAAPSNAAAARLGCNEGAGETAGSQLGGDRRQGQPAEGENGLEYILRRGLERFNFHDSHNDGDSHGNTEFIEAAMTAARREG